MMNDSIQISKIDELPALRPDEWVGFFLLAHHGWWSHIPSRSLGWSLGLRILQWSAVINRQEYKMGEVTPNIHWPM